MVVTPDIPNLPYQMINGIKYFELTAELVRKELLPELFINGWGYNGSIPGPTIQVLPNDDVNIRVINRLPEPTSVHWHGLNVPNVMDGVPEVEPSPRFNQDVILTTVSGLPTHRELICIKHTTGHRSKK